MYDLRLDRKLTKSMFAKWDKETKDWVVNAIASLVVVDQVVESHEMVALQEAIELLDSRNEIENLMNMIKQKISSHLLGLIIFWIGKYMHLLVLSLK